MDLATRHESMLFNFDQAKIIQELKNLEDNSEEQLLNKLLSDSVQKPNTIKFGATEEQKIGDKYLDCDNKERSDGESEAEVAQTEGDGS